MKGVSISDEKNNFLAFDLIDILKIIGEKVLHSTWEISNVECIGKEADRLHSISDNEIPISGEELFSIASNIIQVIDGEFMAYLEDKTNSWLVVKAIDSSEFDVETDDLSVIAKIKNNFSDVTDLPEII